MAGGIDVRRIDKGPLYAIRSGYYSPALVESAKAVPGIRYEGETRAWVGYADAVAAVVALLRLKGLRLDDSALPSPMGWKDERVNLPFATAGLREYQIEGVKFLIQKASEGALLADGMRLGKATALDEPVLTPMGWRKMGDLRVGDQVIGSNGHPTDVTGIYPQGVKAIFTVTMTDGAWARSCGEHLWAVRTGKDKYKGRPYRVMPLHEIVEQGLLQPGTTNRLWFTPIVAPVQFDRAALPIDPYLLGALIANGSLGRSVQHAGSPDQWKVMTCHLPRGMRLGAHVSGVSVGLVPIGHGGPNPVREGLDTLKLTGTHANTKFIPEIYLRASIPQRVALLQGLMDNDGTIDKTGLTAEYNTVSPRLADDVLALIRSLGGVAWMSTRIPTYTYKGETLEGQRDHRVRMSLPPEIIPFQLPRKVSRFKPRTKFLPTHAIDSVEPAGTAKCVCISVAAKDGLYVTRDYIVTHNTCQALTAARAFKVKTLVICPSHVVGVWSRPPTAPEGPGEIAKWWPDAWKLTDEGGGGVVVLEGVAPFKPQDLARKLLKKQTTKAGLTKDETAQLQEAQAKIEVFRASLHDAQVIVTHYDLVYAWVDVLKLWGISTLIIDEIHACQGYDSRRTIAITELASVSRRRQGLSGTPMTSRPRDLHSVLNILCPNRFGYFFAPGRHGTFSNLFCGSYQKQVGTGPEAKVVWDHSGKSNLDEPDGKRALTVEETLHARLQYMMLRRVKSQVDSQLPPKTRQIVDVNIPARQMVMPSEKMLGGRGVELRRCLDLAADGKIKAVVALLKQHLEEGEKVLCFCYRRVFAEVIANEMGCEYVHGGVSQTKRDKRIHDLRTSPNPGVLVATIDTTSPGIDLSFAADAVIAELTWEPHELAQLEERLYKFGAGAKEGSKALIQYVIARGTGDELILRAVISKLDDFEKAIGTTGDRMKEDLSGEQAGRAESALKRLFGALQEMQKTPLPMKKKSKALTA